MVVGVITASIAERQSLKGRYTAESVFRSKGSKGDFMTKIEYEILKEFSKWLIDKAPTLNTLDLPDLLKEFHQEREKR